MDRTRGDGEVAEQLLTTAEVAELARISERTVRRRIASGELPAIDVGRGRMPRWRVRAVHLARLKRLQISGVEKN